MVIQPAEFNQKNKIPFLESNVIKRMCRHRSKNELEDLRKAIHEICLVAEMEYGVPDLLAAMQEIAKPQSEEHPGLPWMCQRRGSHAGS